MDYLMHAAIIGTIATALMDVWGVLRHPLFGFPRLDYALLGRWFGHMAEGQFRHHAISAAAPLRGERLVGLAMHYLVGIAFAALLLAGWGLTWIDRPTLAPALIVGIGTVAAPLLLMQPAMGAELATSKTPNPNAARLQSLLTHAFYGLGLYLAGWVDHLFVR